MVKIIEEEYLKSDFGDGYIRLDLNGVNVYIEFNNSGIGYIEQNGVAIHMMTSDEQKDKYEKIEEKLRECLSLL